ncbi:hypothetical protein KHA85_14790 [Dietzia sp. Marseille-Q0999]|nr:hypothetical protein [Dietzia massiliensis]
MPRSSDAAVRLGGGHRAGRLSGRRLGQRAVRQGARELGQSRDSVGGGAQEGADLVVVAPVDSRGVGCALATGAVEAVARHLEAPQQAHGLASHGLASHGLTTHGLTTHGVVHGRGQGRSGSSSAAGFIARTSTRSSGRTAFCSAMVRARRE